MPNHVTTHCRVYGPADVIGRFKGRVLRVAPVGHSDAGALAFDFDAVIPMPPCIRRSEDETTGGAEIGVALMIARGTDTPPFATLGLYDWIIKNVRDEAGLPDDASIRDVACAYLAKKPEIEAMARNRMTAMLETGYAYWYPWAIANWGTKWGAYRFRELADEPFYSFRFETAWSFPTPIFEVLAGDFPLLAFECATYDEGSNFAGDGWFNPPTGATPFAIGAASDDIYERAYGHPRPVEEDEMAAGAE